MMKRGKLNYHALHVLKSAEPKLRKAVTSNCNKEVINSISEYIHNVLNWNVKLTESNTRKLRRHKAALRKVFDKRMPLSTKKELIVQRDGFFVSSTERRSARDRKRNIFSPR